MWGQLKNITFNSATGLCVIFSCSRIMLLFVVRLEDRRGLNQLSAQIIIKRGLFFQEKMFSDTRWDLVAFSFIMFASRVIVQYGRCIGWSKSFWLMVFRKWLIRWVGSKQDYFSQEWCYIIKYDTSLDQTAKNGLRIQFRIMIYLRLINGGFFNWDKSLMREEHLTSCQHFWKDDQYKLIV